MTIFAADPGIDGALFQIDRYGYQGLVMPTSGGKKREINLNAVRDWMRQFPIHAADNPHMIIEYVGPMPKQGVCSMFSFGCGWGMLRGLCTGMHIPYTLVRPQAWQKVMLAGHGKGSEFQVASALFPNQNWLASPRCRKAHSGLIDAALIAEYGRRMLNGERHVESK